MKKSIQILEKMMEFAYENLSDSSDNDQEEEEKKEEFWGYLEIIGSEEESGPKTKNILNNKTSLENDKMFYNYTRFRNINQNYG